MVGDHTADDSSPTQKSVAAPLSSRSISLKLISFVTVYCQQLSASDYICMYMLKHELKQ